MNNKKLVIEPTIKFNGPFSGILFSLLSLLLLDTIKSLKKIYMNVIPFSRKVQTHESYPLFLNNL